MTATKIAAVASFLISVLFSVCLISSYLKGMTAHNISFTDTLLFSGLLLFGTGVALYGAFSKKKRNVEIA